MKYSWTSRRDWLRLGGYLAIFTAGCIMADLTDITLDFVSGFFVMVVCVVLWIGGMRIVDSQGREERES